MRPLYDKIRQINSDLKARFCMPGHSGEGMSENMYSTACLDWTEVDGLDDLLQSGGVILDSEKLIADSMGCEYALMLTQGSTCGMQIAVASAKERGETLAAVGEMHRSFWSACRLFGMQVICFADARELADTELRDKKIGGVFVTSPDYFGRTKDLGALKKISEEIGALFVVDGAHSAHFCYSSLLPDNSCKIADISLISMHKTLPVYGGGALVCVNGDETYAVCRKYRADIHSTSPNYLTMASMDRADGYMRKNGERLYADLKKDVDAFISVNKIGRAIERDDFSRLTLKIEGKDAYSAMKDLARRGVYAEAAYGDMLVFIVTPFNGDKLEALANELKKTELTDIDDDFERMANLKLKRSDASGCAESVEISDAAGRVSAGEIGVYPPGVPFVKKGDVIDEKTVSFLKKYRNRLFGLASGRVNVIKY